MYIFLVILAFGKKIRLVRLEPKPNRNNREPKYSVPEISWNRSVPIFYEPNFFKNRGTEPNGRTQCPPLVLVRACAAACGALARDVVRVAAPDPSAQPP